MPTIIFETTQLAEETALYTENYHILNYHSPWWAYPQLLLTNTGSNNSSINYSCPTFVTELELTLMNVISE